ncbi:MAG: AAA family ATPase [Pseudomonadota bacterium]
MYLKFFGLAERPFAITPDIQYFYLGRQHEKVLDTLMYGIEQRLGFVMLTGEVGTGKTMITRTLLSRLNGEVDTALIINPLMSVSELLRSITKDFGMTIRFNSPQKQIDALNTFLLANVEKGRNALVVIDEAQNLSTEALEMLRMLTNLETAKKKLLQIMLVGQPELLKMLANYELRQLNQRITARSQLAPLSFIEMIQYINHRVCTAGGGGRVFFEPKACKLLHAESKGVPRLVNLLCDRALMAAFVRETCMIDKPIMKSAIVDWRGRTPTSRWGFIKRLVFSS